jgi:Zn-dependent metalloprotease
MFTPEPKSAKTLATYTGTRAIRRDATEMARRLDAKTRGHLKVRWSRRTGAPRSVRGVMTEPAAGSVEDIARQFLADQHQLFGMPDDLSDLHYVQAIERRGVWHVTFRQMYANMPVFGANILVHIDQGDRVQMVNGDYYTAIKVETSSAPIAKPVAVEAVMSELGLSGAPPADTRADMVIFPHNGQYCRAYQVMLRTQDPLGNWVYFVDAASGEVVDGYNAIYFVKGKGSIYNMNPKRDNDEVVTAELFDLEGDKTLTGAYFVVENDAGPEAVAPTDTHEFIYEADNSHFDEAMVYYHLSRAAEFFRNLGHKTDPEPLFAHVHVPNPYTNEADYDNAYYSSFEQAFYFGHGKVFNDLAQEAAVIYHEYTHAVVDMAQPVMGTHEANALHEGYADYFACSLTNDPQIGEYVVGSTGTANLRNLRNQKTYDDLTGTDVHVDGEIWGVTCWKLREALGVRIADLLVYESLWFLPPNASFQDACDGLLQADANLFNSAYQPEIEAILTEQNLTEGPAPTYTITASAGEGGAIVPSGAVVVEEGQEQTFDLVPDDGYLVQDVLLDEVSVGAVLSYTFTNVTASHTITAQFEVSQDVPETTTVTIPGNTDWLDTGVSVVTGDILTFTASGTVMYDNRDNSCGPDGASWTDERDKQDPIWDKPHAGLIGKIAGTGLPFFIGDHYKVRAGSEGNLVLGINDHWYQSNSGEFTVTIQVEKERKHNEHNT